MTILKECTKVVSRIQSERLREQQQTTQSGPPGVASSTGSSGPNPGLGAGSGYSSRQEGSETPGLGGDYCNLGSAEILSEFLNHDPFLNLAIIWNSEPGESASLWVNANEWKELI